MNGARVLVVDDDLTVREVVVSYLRAHGHDVLEADDGAGALAAIRAGGLDLLVLDVMLPDLDGLEVLRRLRSSGSTVPVILLTALGSEPDRIAGLEHGADDYVSKPFSPRELALRVESVLRRTGRSVSGPEGPLVDGGLVLDPVARTVVLDGRELGLTQREFDLLRHLMGHPDVALGRDELLREVWGWAVGDHSTVTVHVRRVREKIEDDPRSPRRLLTVWGVGYRWCPSGSEQGAP